MQQGGRQTGREYEKQIQRLAQGILHVVAENQQKVHIPNEMGDAAMKEHGGDERHAVVAETFRGNQAPFFCDRFQVSACENENDDADRGNKPCNNRNEIELRCISFDWKS